MSGANNQEINSVLFKITRVFNPSQVGHTSIGNNRLADKVIAAFKNVLNDKEIAALSEKELHELNLIVREALSQQLSSAAKPVEETARQLKSMTDHQDIGL